MVSSEVVLRPSGPRPHRYGLKDRPERDRRPNAPSAARQTWISGVIPVFRAYAVRTTSANSPARLGANQVDRAAGPAGAGELSPEEAGGGLGRFDQGVERRRAVLEVVAAGGVRGRHQPAECDDVARLQVLDPLAHPLVLAQDVPGSLASDRVEAGPSRPRVARATPTRAGIPLGAESGPGTPRRRARTRRASDRTSRRPAVARSWSRRRRSPGPGHPEASGHGPACRNRGTGRDRRGRTGWRTGRAGPSRPPTNSFSDRRRVLASSMRCRSPISRVKSCSTSARDHAELDQEPGDRGLEARRAGQPRAEWDVAEDDGLEARSSGPHHSVRAQQTPRT